MDIGQAGWVGWEGGLGDLGQLGGLGKGRLDGRWVGWVCYMGCTIRGWMGAEWFPGWLGGFSGLGGLDCGRLGEPWVDWMEGGDRGGGCWVNRGRVWAPEDFSMPPLQCGRGTSYLPSNLFAAPSPPGPLTNWKASGRLQ